MKNPIKQARERVGMSMADLAVALGCSRDLLYLLESGQIGSLTEKNIKAFSDIGLDGEALASEYAKWKDMRSEELKEKARRH